MGGGGRGIRGRWQVRGTGDVSITTGDIEATTTTTTTKKGRGLSSSEDGRVLLRLEREAAVAEAARKLRHQVAERVRVHVARQKVQQLETSMNKNIFNDNKTEKHRKLGIIPVKPGKTF